MSELVIYAHGRIVSVDTTRHVEVGCPYCAKKHLHGWPFEDKKPGRRVAHCHNGLGYELVIK
jgi:hypothetical protein